MLLHYFWDLKKGFSYIVIYPSIVCFCLSTQCTNYQLVMDICPLLAAPSVEETKVCFMLAWSSISLAVLIHVPCHGYPQYTSVQFPLESEVVCLRLEQQSQLQSLMSYFCNHKYLILGTASTVKNRLTVTSLLYSKLNFEYGNDKNKYGGWTVEFDIAFSQFVEYLLGGIKNQWR